MRTFLAIYFIFFKISCVIFGGGYTIFPFIRSEIIKKRNWITEDELIEYFSVAQCSPGIITANLSIFIGYKKSGILGAFAALLGIITPPIIIISIISLYFDKIVENPYALKFFKGINIGVIALLTSTFISMVKKSILDKLTFFIFIFLAILSIIFNVSPVYIILIAIFFAILKCFFKRGDNL